MTLSSYQFSLSDLDRMHQFKVKLFFSKQAHDNFNFIGRILGRKGENLQAIESDCQCKIAILGRGSLRSKEEQHKFQCLLGYEHLKEDLHLLITTIAFPHQAFERISKAITILKPYLHPDTAVNVQPYNRRQFASRQLFNIDRSMIDYKNLSIVPSFILKKTFRNNFNKRKKPYYRTSSSPPPFSSSSSSLLNRGKCLRNVIKANNHEIEKIC